MIKKTKQKLYRLLFFSAVASGLYVAWQPDVKALKTSNPSETAFMRLRQNQARESRKPYLQRHHWVPYDEISSHLVHAVIVAEDASFYRHEGIDLDGLKEAMKKNLEKGKIRRGGSTITQQVAKNLYLSPSRNPLRKLKEALIAWRMDRHLSKRRIMEIYLNTAEWGLGIFGAEAASRYYFDKPAAELTPEEAAMLAALLPSPLRYGSSLNGRYMTRMVRTILIRMKARRFLPENYLIES